MVRLSNILALLTLSLLLTNCSKIGTDRTRVELNVESDTDVLNARVNRTPAPIPFFSPGEAELSSKMGFPDNQLQSSYNFVEIAHIDIPSERLGVDAGATYLAVAGNYLYITYNTAGVDYAGGVDAYNLSTGLLESLTYTIDSGESNDANQNLSSFEWNSLSINGNRLAVIGDTPNGALLFDVEYNLGVSIPATKREIELPGVSGNAVGVWPTDTDNSYYASVGGDEPGGIFQILTSNNELTLNANNQMLSSGMKYLSIWQNWLVAFKGRSGASLYTYAAGRGTVDISLSDPLAVTDLGFSDVVPELGKNDVSIFDGKAYVATGNAGFYRIDLAAGTIELEIDLDGTTNAVTADNDFIYAASGERFYILDATDGTELAMLSYSDASSNYVFSFDFDFGQGSQKVIALANGKDGVRLIAAVPAQDVVFSGLPSPENTSVFGLNNAMGGFQFEVLDGTGNVIDQMGGSFWPMNGDGRLFFHMQEGSTVRSTYSNGSVEENDVLSTATIPENLNDDPQNRSISITSRYIQASEAIMSLDNRSSNEYARVRVDVVGQSNSERILLLPPNSRTYFKVPRNSGNSTVRLRSYTGRNMKTAVVNPNVQSSWSGF
jgi:hypothetical protein